ncbi:penicillin-binding protein activator [Silvimonas amylolytica]|nr:penicillin-binding protein activator [Silvimonas amylolytica]
MLAASPLRAEPVVQFRIASAPAASQPASEAASAPVSAAASSPQAAPVKGGNFIAVLLPTKAKAWRPAVEAIKSGLFAAESALSDGNQPPLRVFDTTDADEDILAQFERASQMGAAAVIGPLTKSAVNKLADSGEFSFPVLALNSFDSETPRQLHLFSFSLSIEAEAAQVARQMRADGYAHPMVVSVDGALPLRMTQGFTDGWRALGVEGASVIKLGPKDMPQLKAQLDLSDVDAVFLAMDERMARRVRPFIGTGRPIYATSQINTGKQSTTALLDLAGIHYLDMPWLINPDNPEYKIYEHARSPSNDLERLFAMGVDAWKIAAALLVTPPDQISVPDGLSGRLRMDSHNVIQRELTSGTLSVSIPNAEAPGYTETPVTASAPASAP